VLNDLYSSLQIYKFIPTKKRKHTNEGYSYEINKFIHQYAGTDNDCCGVLLCAQVSAAEYE